jgi:hypothetical protein
MFLKIRKNIKHWIRKIKKFLIFFWRKNSNRFFYVTIKNHVPRINVNESYQDIVKWGIRLLAGVGIVTSVLAFEVWYLNLIMALTFLGLEIALEKVIFVYYTMYLTVFPEYDHTDWRGMLWTYPLEDAPRRFELGMFYSSREAAGKIFSVFKHWAKDGSHDINNLIQISIIIDEENDDYHVYVYPNAEKDPDYLRVKDVRDNEFPNKEHIMHVGLMMCCKGFKYSTSMFTKFESLYKEGESYNFCAYVFENETPVKLRELGCIRKESLKIKKGDELTPEDREYDHYRLMIDRKAYENEPNPPPSQEHIMSSGDLD